MKQIPGRKFSDFSDERAYRHVEAMEEEYKGTIKTRRACNQRRAACLLSMQNARNFLYEDTSDVSRIMMTFHVSAHPANWLDKDPYKKG